MLLKRAFLLSFQFGFVFLYSHEKPVAQALWPEPCTKGQRILNDCNWCVCKNQKYTCTARICSEIDMFGHFTDQIRTHILGMEGHGSWRSNGTICQPKSFYQRDGLLCICDDDGNWPNPVCRDIFRFLHEVEVTDKSVATAGEQCVATRLYLYGCNVCICPSTGVIDPDVCTKNNCTDDDPVFNKNEGNSETELEEVYANCETGQKYEIGCGFCMCLKNNRFLCDKCNQEDDKKTRQGSDSYCSGVDANTIITIDCNVCYCNENKMLICTTKKCRNFKDNQIDVPAKPEGVRTIELVEAPISEEDCIPGTQYKRDCNICFCALNSEGKNVLGCTMKGCPSKSSVAALRSDCVLNTAYEVDCLECNCVEVDGDKTEVCLVDSKCNMPETNREPRSSNFYDLHGYCEPAHIYSKDCNTCRCLSDGKTVICSSRICKKPDSPIVVDIMPVIQKGSKPCPKDHMYKVDCNFCFCLNNGNVLCTTSKCDTESK